MKTLALGILSTTVLACGAFAGDEVSSKSYKEPVPTAPCFKDQELQLDLFGSFINMTRQDDGYFHDFDHHDHDFDHHDSDHHHDFSNNREGNRNGGGGGVGVNYFFLRYLGVGVDGDLNSTRNGLWDVTGKLIARYPIQMGSFCLAPYAFGGGGLVTDAVTAGSWVAGGGVEFRVTPMFGIFAEGRYTWVPNYREDENVQARLGLRIAF